MFFYAAQVYENKAKLEQEKMIKQTEKSLQSNTDEILTLKGNDIKTTTKIASLIEKNENLVRKLEEIKSEQYLDELTSEILHDGMKGKDFSAGDVIKTAGLLVSIFGSSAIVTSFYGVLGGWIGGAIGSVVPGLGNVLGASAGYYIGISLGGVSVITTTPDVVRNFYKRRNNKDVVITGDCKQQ